MIQMIRHAVRRNSSEVTFVMRKKLVTTRGMNILGRNLGVTKEFGENLYAKLSDLYLKFVKGSLCSARALA